jgi:adenine-specific DNA-methyltransferase
MNYFELTWKGKNTQVEKVFLPFQKIEEVNLSKASKETLLPELRENDSSAWKNKLIWGDNKYVLNSLLNDSSVAGKIKLIYIDPPFFTGTNMNIDINIGSGTEVTKEPSAIEEVAYRNMWKEGPSSFFQYMYERFVLMKDLLSDDGSIWVRFDYHYSHYIKLILDEIFGYENFRNEIIINRTLAKQPAKNNFTQQTESLFFYGKTENNFFKQVRIKIDPKWYPLLDFPRADKKPRTIKNVVFYPPENRRWALSQENIDQHKTRINSNEEYIDCRGKKIKGYPELLYDEKVIRNDWLDIKGYGQSTGYPTENSEELLNRVISASSEKGDLVADFFAGSGTTAAVAERLGRKWIACDIGRFSIHTIRKRLLEIPTCQPFEVLNLGKYERQQWVLENTNGDYRSYILFILQLYGAKPLDNFSFIAGKKGVRAVHVGPIDSPMLKEEIWNALKESKKAGFNDLDVLGWEWELGLNDSIIKEAKSEFGINLALKVIPREVMDKRATDAGDVKFYELAYLKAGVEAKRSDVKIKLDKFIIPNVDDLPKEIKDKVKDWSDYIDYWAVDWDFNGVFHNEWQTYRTKRNQKLEMETPLHTYNKKGKHKIQIKVIDIFGNDTSTIKEVSVP